MHTYTLTEKSFGNVRNYFAAFACSINDCDNNTRTTKLPERNLLDPCVVRTQTASLQRAFPVRGALSVVQWKRSIQDGCESRIEQEKEDGLNPTAL